MFTKEVTIHKAAVGLMPRPVAAVLVQKAYEFKSRIWVEKDDNRADSRSLLDMLSLLIHDGDKVSIIADGTDEQEAVASLAQLVESTPV